MVSCNVDYGVYLHGMQIGVCEEKRLSLCWPWLIKGHFGLHSAHYTDQVL